MRRWHVVVQQYDQGIWREHKHAGRTYAFRERRVAEQWARNFREIYPNKAQWSVSVARRTVK